MVAGSRDVYDMAVDGRRANSAVARSGYDPCATHGGLQRQTRQHTVACRSAHAGEAERQCESQRSDPVQCILHRSAQPAGTLRQAQAAPANDVRRISRKRATRAEQSGVAPVLSADGTRRELPLHLHAVGLPGASAGFRRAGREALRTVSVTLPQSLSAAGRGSEFDEWWQRPTAARPDPGQG